MKIGHRIRKLERYLTALQPGDKFYLGVSPEPKIEARLQEMGFSTPLAPGERQLPGAQYGPACRRNADGFVIKHRDQPKETATRQIYWEWEERHGSDRITRSDYRDVPYQRYPRTEVAPYGQEVQIVVRADGEIFAVAGPLQVTVEHDAEATNTANMLVELFGNFEVLNADLQGWVRSPVRKLNWELLPPGPNPWASALPALGEFVKLAPVGNQKVVGARINHVEKFQPDYIARGLGGFSRYVAFVFKRHKLCILESTEVNNATYILDIDSWEDVSQLSKAAVLQNDLHRARVFHNASWFSQLDRLIPLDRAEAA